MAAWGSQWTKPCWKIISEKVALIWQGERDDEMQGEVCNYNKIMKNHGIQEHGMIFAGPKWSGVALIFNKRAFLRMVILRRHLNTLCAYTYKS